MSTPWHLAFSFPLLLPRLWLNGVYLGENPGSELLCCTLVPSRRPQRGAGILVSVTTPSAKANVILNPDLAIPQELLASQFISQC